MAQESLIRELAAAVERSPEVLELRLHLAELLIGDGRFTEALGQCSSALSQDAGNAVALTLLQRCTAGLGGAAPAAAEPVAVEPAAAGFNWTAAEDQVSDIIEPAFIEREHSADGVDERDFDVVQRSEIRLADVAGMPEVKQQLDVALLGPIRNPEVMKAFKISARGGLLLYGPPGCGKTYLARAVSGELGAAFYPVGIADILAHYLEDCEKTLRQVFETARRNAPCVLFFDELDALGLRRSSLSNSAGLRMIVNTLLAELDSATESNEGVYVIGATNMPWDVDPALRRPGRFDRVIFVGLPDRDAREQILRMNLQDRPVAGIDVVALAARTDGLSGADLAHLCDTATQLAMADSVRSGQVRPVQMADMDAARSQIRPSTGPWFDIARNVVEFGNSDGTYDELAAQLRRKKSR